MKKLVFIGVFALFLNTTCAQTLFVRPIVGSQSAYPVANIQKLTFSNGNLVVTNTTGPNGTFALADNRYLNFTDLTLGNSFPEVSDSKFYLYPNPSSQWIQIANTNPDQTKNTVEIISVEGKLLMALMATTEVTQIDVSLLPKGMYLCRISNSNRHQILKFIKQ